MRVNSKKPEVVTESSREEKVYNKPERPIIEDKGKLNTLEEVEQELEEDTSEDDEKSIETDIKLDRLGRGRVFCMVIVAILSCCILAGVVWGVYYNYIRYPDMAEYNIGSSGKTTLTNWSQAIKTLDNEKIKAITGEDSYIAKEVEYANEKEYQIEFVQKMVDTVRYKPNKVEALDKYGNVLVNESNQVVFMDSLVNGEDEKVTLYYVDYTKVVVDPDRIKSIMAECDLAVGDPDYTNRLVEVFCKYMTTLGEDELPIISVSYRPNLVKMGDGYVLSPEEDIYIDKLLFSSDEFYGLLNRFSVAASSKKINPQWTKWNKLSAEKKKTTAEPVKYLGELKPTKEWTKWSKSKSKDTTPEPVKYNNYEVISSSWCGSYHLLNESSSVDADGNPINNPVTAEVGDGSFNNPAGLNTNVVTVIYDERDVKEGKNRKSTPIRVRLTDIKLGQDAVDYFEGKDERNRGFDLKSEIKYVAYNIEVTNLSNHSVSIYDDSSLCDGSVNMTHRTGIIYGLQDSITLQPHESGIIESWGCSTILEDKYLVWGKNFHRDKDVVWFRVLAGNK